jgi:AcrR family transcriptional regulator
MEQKNLSTKQRILDAALTLFSVNGYESVSVAEIADAVGIKAPSLYKHFKSKQEIFDAIIEEMDARYERQAASLQMDGREAALDKELYEQINESTLIGLGLSLFHHFLHDDYTSKFRKMLTIEQYNNDELAKMYAKRYIDEPLAYQERTFGFLVKAGVLIPENPRVMAIHFYSPIHLLLVLCDSNPEREEEALKMIEWHIKQFNWIYGNRNSKQEGS